MLTGSIIGAVKWLMIFFCWHTQRWHVQVKALPWYSSVRKIIVDPAYAGFFLHFKCNKSASDDKVLPGEGGCHVPRQNMTLYHGAPLRYRLGSFGPSAEAVGKTGACGFVCALCRPGADVPRSHVQQGRLFRLLWRRLWRISLRSSQWIDAPGVVSQ